MNLKIKIYEKKKDIKPNTNGALHTMTLRLSLRV